jgi:hypothetical protein
MLQNGTLGRLVSEQNRPSTIIGQTAPVVLLPVMPPLMGIVCSALCAN